MKKKLYIHIFIIFYAPFLHGWTNFYQELYDVSNMQTNHTKKSIVFSKYDLPEFTQIVASWNIHRPKKGMFQLYIQVRNAQLKTWGDWHHMFDWGSNIQKSYYSKTDGTSHYAHVRLESEKNNTLDAFRIKVIAKDTDCSCIKGLFASVSNLRKFKSESCICTKNFESLIVPNVDQIPQFSLPHRYAQQMCSPSACAMVSHYITSKKYNAIHFANQVYDGGLGIYGSWPFNVAHLFDVCNGVAHVYVKRLASFKDLYAQLKNNCPVIVSVRGVLPGAIKPFNNGHLMVVVGFDAKKQVVICHDSACKKAKEVEKRYAIKDFVQAWERSHRLAYIIKPIK